MVFKFLLILLIILEIGCGCLVVCVMIVWMICFLLKGGVLVSM